VAPGILEKGLLLDLRFKLDQYINLRPVKLLPGVETPLAGRARRTSISSSSARTPKTSTAASVATSRRARPTRSRCSRPSTPARAASGASAGPSTTRRKRNSPKKTLTLVAKTNVLTYGHDLWWRTFQEVAKDYPDVKPDYNHVDACCMWMVKNPDYYDVIVTTNMFGDIITDLGGILQGGMGVAAGANLNPDKGGVSMFEPMGAVRPSTPAKT